MKIQTSADISF